MRTLHYAALSVLALGAALPLARAQSVSISADITGEVVPGVYGHVVIGNGAPPPPVLYAQPVVALPAPVIVGASPVEPIYLHVPPGHAKNWRKHCHEYNACNRPVYFVKSAEYDPDYRPDHYDHDHDHGHGHGHDRDHDHDRGHHDD